MRHTDPDQYHGHRPSKRLGAVLAVVALGAAVGVGAYGLLLKPRSEPRPQPAPTATATASPAPTPAMTPPPAPQRDPEAFATRVAHLLFDWDTLATSPAAIKETLIGLADPTGDETAGLASDLGNYLPDATTWAKLRRHGTRQSLDIGSVAEPASWQTAQADAQPGAILPGTAAYTIAGARHREGVWQDQPTSSDHDVSFTVFVTCAPSFPECHLMRLSQLDNPLN